MNKPILSGLVPDELKKLVAAAGEPAFRGRQLTEWLYRKLVLDPDRMTNLSPKLKDFLKAETIPCSSTVCGCAESPDDTAKLLIQLHDGEKIEMVIIPSPDRMTFCLSTQVGCPVRCRFCASGADGLIRNLEAAEMIEQVVHGAARIGKLPDNIVFMGIGEGLMNFPNLSRALEILTSAEMIGMSPRRITVSTSGYVPGIQRLAELGKPFVLAVSLHAVDDRIRAQIIPDGLRYPIAEILEACSEYREKIGRMITFEYTLLAGINDRESDAFKLAEIARKQHAKVNLIPYNAVNGDFRRPAPEVIRRFKELLESRHPHVTLRQEKGSSANAACGQLRRSHKA